MEEDIDDDEDKETTKTMKTTRKETETKRYSNL